MNLLLGSVIAGVALFAGVLLAPDGSRCDVDAIRHQAVDEFIDGLEEWE